MRYNVTKLIQRGDTMGAVIIQMKFEFELLRTLAESDDDIKNERVAPMQDSFNNLRTSLLARKTR